MTLLYNKRTGRTATYVIAASDAPYPVKAQADEVLPATGAQTLINASLAAYRNVFISGGTASNVYISAPILLPDTNDFSLTSNHVWIRLSDNANCVMIQKTTPDSTNYRGNLVGLNITGNKANNPTGSYGIDATGFEHLNIGDCYISSTKGTGVYGLTDVTHTANGLYLDNVQISNTDAYGLKTQGCAAVVLNTIWIGLCASGGWLAEGGYELYGDNVSCDQDLGHEIFFSSVQRASISNIWVSPSAQFKAGIYLYACRDVQMNGGNFIGNSQNTYGVYFYSVDGEDGCTVSNFTFAPATGITFVYGVRQETAGTAITNCKVTNCVFKSILQDALTGAVRQVEVIGNQGYIAKGEIRTISGTISTLTENAFNSIDNPFGQSVAVTKLDIYVSTAATATSPNIDCGIGSSTTTDYATMFEDLPGETIGFYSSTIATPGTQTVPILWASGSGNRYLNMSIKDAAATGMIASYVVTVMGV